MIEMQPITYAWFFCVAAAIAVVIAVADYCRDRTIHYSSSQAPAFEAADVIAAAVSRQRAFETPKDVVIATLLMSFSFAFTQYGKWKNLAKLAAGALGVLPLVLLTVQHFSH